MYAKFFEGGGVFLLPLRGGIVKIFGKFLLSLSIEGRGSFGPTEGGILQCTPMDQGVCMCVFIS